MAENVIVLEPGDERAQKIAKAMASQTANDILHLLGEGQKSLTEITERLAIPLTTSKYHIENLLDAGLISVTETKYSVKGREVKIYSLTNQLLIVAPKQLNVRSLLLKYASLFSIVVFGTIIVGLLSSLKSTPGSMNALYPQEAERFFNHVALKEAALNVSGSTPSASAVNVSMTPVPAPSLNMSGSTLSVYVPSTDTALAFFIGGLVVILILLSYELYLWKKQQ